MQTKEIRYKLLYGFIILVMFLPLLQRYLHFRQERPLQGAYVSAVAPEFTSENWLEGKYQDSANAWLNESFGFRTTLVRLRNQVGWELFGYSYANSTIAGKDGYLFDIDNMKAYNGKDFIGIDSVKFHVAKIRQLQDKLAAQGITLIVVLAPGKASFYHEYLPENQQQVVGPTNYETYRNQFESSGVNLLDFHRWFDQLKTKTEYPLYPKCGVHWSRLGALFAADSLISYVSSKVKQPMPRFVFDRIYTSDTLQDPDFDIGSAMNLLVDVDPPPMAYADFHAGNSVPGIQPRALVVGDSYFWTMPSKEMQETAFKGIDFFYYNHDLFPNSDPGMKVGGTKVNLLAEIAGCDVVILLSTEANLLRFPWGFDEQALYAFSDAKKANAEYRRMHVAYIENGIRKDENWFGKIRMQAEKENQDIDSAVRKNAEWVFDWQQEEKKKFKTK